MIRYVVKFENGMYKTQFKKNGKYGQDKFLYNAMFYSSEKSALENTQNSDIPFEIVKVEIKEKSNCVDYET